MAEFGPVIRQQGFKLGISAPGSVLHFAQSGTSTPAEVFAPDGTTLGTTLAADVTGRFPAFVLGPSAYRVTLKDDAGVTIWGPEDHVQALSGMNPPSEGTAGQVLTSNGPGVEPSFQSPPVTVGACNGRLSLTSGVAVTTADVLAATTLYWVPIDGGEVALYTGTAWVKTVQAQLSIAIPALASTPCDVFIDYNSGTPGLALIAWTNDTTRATALATQDGVLVLTGFPGRRYVGTIRTTAVSGQCEDSFRNRYVWNYYYRVRRGVRVNESTNSWTYTTAAYREANGATTNRVSVVVGVAGSLVSLRLQAFGINSTGGGTPFVVAIGEDGIVPISGQQILSPVSFASTLYQTLGAQVDHYPAIGHHYYPWLEYSTAGGTTTWYGDNNTPTLAQSGMTGRWEA